MYKILSKNASRRILSGVISSKKQDDSDDFNIIPSYIEEAIKTETLVQGLIESKNNGGYRILVRGTSCFCPFSLFPRIDDEEFFNLVKNKIILNFKVSKADDVNNIIVSRIDVAKQEGILSAKQIYDNKNYIYGKVMAVKDYGAFVDIGGISGLLHISKFKSNSQPIVGDTVKVIIIAIDFNLFKISLSSLIDEEIYSDEYKKIEVVEKKNSKKKKSKTKNNKSNNEIKIKCKFCNIEIFSKRLKGHIKRVHSNIKNSISFCSEETNINKSVIICKDKKFRSLYNKYGV